MVHDGLLALMNSLAHLPHNPTIGLTIHPSPSHKLSLHTLRSVPISAHRRRSSPSPIEISALTDLDAHEASDLVTRALSRSRVAIDTGQIRFANHRTICEERHASGPDGLRSTEREAISDWSARKRRWWRMWRVAKEPLRGPSKSEPMFCREKGF